jgi:Tfp pilus assembly protein PilN
MENSNLIMLIIGIVTCVVGILTFVGSQIEKAKNDGRLEQKIDDLKAQIEKLDKHSDRITILEQSQKSMWIKVDKITENLESVTKLLNEIEIRCAKMHN